MSSEQQRHCQGQKLSSGSLSIRFNPASINDDDDEFDLFTNEYSLHSRSKEVSKPDLSGLNYMSSSGTKASRTLSAPVPRESPPHEFCTHSKSDFDVAQSLDNSCKASTPGSKEDNEKSFISGIREKFQDPLNTFMDKLEEFKSESQIVETLERKLRKSDSLDVGTSQSPLNVSDRKRHASLDEDVGGHELEFVDDNFFAEAGGKPSVYQTKAVHHTDSSETLHHPKQAVETHEKQKFVDAVQSPETETNDQEFFDAKDELSLLDKNKKDPEVRIPSSQMLSLHDALFDSTFHQRSIAFSVVIIAYLLIPLPTYLSGWLLGIGCGVGGVLFYQWLTAAPTEKKIPTPPGLEKPMDIPSSMILSSEVKYQGWMNELTHYDEDNYHINLTHSVFVTLEECRLRMQTPRSSIPKRAMWNETIPSMSFINQRFFDLKGAKVHLLPEKLVSKRLWSKKYPIGITINLPLLEQPTSDKLSKESNEENGVEGVLKEKRITLYLFGRTGREKEEWYRRLQAASNGCPWPLNMSVFSHGKHELHATQRRTFSTPSALDSLGSSSAVLSKTSSCDSSPPPSPTKTYLIQNLNEYVQYMSRVMPTGDKVSSKQKRNSLDSAGSVNPIMPRLDKTGTPLCDSSVVWLNAFLSRCFWDFLRENYWCLKIQEKLQKKLCKIHVPYFIDQLTVTGIELGSEVPTIRRVSSPTLDHRGLWLYLDVNYRGGFQMQLETKCNLMKLKKDSGNTSLENGIPMTDQSKSAVTHSDEEDSAESSTDEEEESYIESRPEESKQVNAPSRTQRGSGRLLRLVDRIAQSRYFQQATENKYIKRAMEGVSNTRLVLTVEVKAVCGTLAVNIPPPPTDRIWYGFHGNPQLCLVARPRVGHRELNVTHITDWIEKKLAVEFQRVFVMPNMDDLLIPLMCDQLQ